MIFIPYPGALELIRRLPILQARVHDVADDIAGQTADNIHSITGETADSVHVEQTTEGSQVVVGGAGPFLEFGTVHMAAQAPLRRAADAVAPGKRTDN